MQMHVTCYVQKDLWLEIRPCHETSSTKAKELGHEMVLRIPALSEALKAVEKASLDIARKKGDNIWEYSCKLDSSGIDDVTSLFTGTQEQDNGRSITRSLDLLYYGRCYTLTLFMFK